MAEANPVLPAPTHNLSNDLSNPYFLHANKNPSLVLIAPTLNGSNFHSWSRAMRMALQSKNKLHFVDGTITTPAQDDPQYSAWERCNTMVLSWLMHSIEPSLVQSLIWFDTAADVWADLRERFGKGDFIRIADLQREIYSLNQGILSVNEYFTQFKVLWDQLQQFRPIPSCKCVETGASSCEAIKV